MNDKPEQQNQSNEEYEDREVKPEWFQSAGELVVDSEQRRYERSIGLIAGQRTESGRVLKEERNISQFADGRVVFDRMGIVEVKAVLKMVCIGCEDGDQQQRATQARDVFF